MCQPQPQPSRQLLPASPRHPPRLHSRSHFCHFNGFGREWVMRENFFIRSGTKDLKIKLVEFASGECQNKLCSEELSKKVDLISAVISLLSYTFPQNILTTTFSLSCWTFPQGLPATRCQSLSLEWQAVFFMFEEGRPLGYLQRVVTKPSGPLISGKNRDDGVFGFNDFLSVVQVNLNILGILNWGFFHTSFNIQPFSYSKLRNIKYINMLNMSQIYKIPKINAKMYNY